MQGIFIYGTLRDPEILEIVIGAEAKRVAKSGALLGYRARAQKDAPYPVIVADAMAEAPGLLLQGFSEEARAKLCFFEALFGYRLLPATVGIDGAEIDADVFFPEEPPETLEEDWSIDVWRKTEKAFFVEMAHEVMALFGGQSFKHPKLVQAGIFRRSLSRMRAKQTKATGAIRSRFDADAVRIEQVDNLYTGFFTARRYQFSHSRFDGGHSGDVQREVFVTGDAVTVLPWDPTTNNVLLVEQIRAGAIARGDPNPWCLEPIAGICDANESTETTARREALEEAGLELGPLEKIGEYYSSAGGVAEYTTAYLAQADLTDAGGIFGLVSEQEDIRAVVVPLQDALAAIETGEIRVAQLIISLLALAQKSDGLRQRWGFKVAGDNLAH